MTHEQILELLDDFVGGDLPPREEREVRRHLMACEGCRAEEQALRALLDQAAALADEVLPERDLWDGIVPRLQARDSFVEEPVERIPEVRVIGPRPARPLPWWMLAAASIALVATTSFATLRISGAGDDAGPAPTLPAQAAQAPAGSGGTPTALAAFRPAEQEYEKAIGDLQAVLRARRGQMAPQTVATLETNLRIIDQAIRESRAALAADPNSPELTRMLSGAYDAKLDVLRRAVSL
ncbi:MAG TPA: zf-HC2 domain-containing protein [Longimicrobium sp.]|jgi:anti-sigma factor RsiW|uniref:zf-HC2 domain-containing protein n=1 Tax=Longimicrobium sp. TaxID=2029185 RepID=UPI002EDA77E7